jgi:hypothetical protein
LGDCLFARSYDGKMVVTLRRGIYMAVGLAFLCLSAFIRTINGSPIPAWWRVMVIVGGLFFFYCGVMYYLPRHRRRRKELADLLDEAERKVNGPPESR